MVNAIKSFVVEPYIPDKIKRLKELAYNLWWVWEADARELFIRLDMELWEKSNHNPVFILNNIDQKVLEEKAEDDTYLFLYNRVLEKFDQFINKEPWFKKKNGYTEDLQIAYFSMEYGLTECLPIYSGGLGVLSGDHLKSASELGIPLFGVGLLYRRGYFKQKLNINGWQDEEYLNYDFYNLPVLPLVDENNNPVVIEVDFPGRKVKVNVWKVLIGRIILYLLDTDNPDNAERDRRVTESLYGGDLETRIQQEIVLGMGGTKLIEYLGDGRIIYHLNEGHSAFSALERVRSLIKREGLNFPEALEVVKSGTVFTTHTPVKAGIDIFPRELMEKYFSNYCRDLGIKFDQLWQLGVGDNSGDNSFSMAILAIKLSNKINSVSKLHRSVSRRMWRNLWKGLIEDEVPIIHITNGVHQPSWISKEMADLFDRYIGPKWKEEPADQKIWEKVEEIPDVELWKTHERRKERLIGFARRELKKQYIRLGKSKSEVERIDSVLDTDAMAIGFARRFAAYKRGALIFHNPDRLAKILTNKEMPVQIIIAGNAHPKDMEGKKLIKKIIDISNEEPFRQSIVFLESYNINIARYMLQGCDVWLNNPRRGLEACGTSGMKAVANGGIHVSTLDGWWDEAYNPEIGWAIGRREEYADYDYWDEQDANALYNLLEKEIIPLYFKRDKNGMPRDWIKLMKRSMISICPVFNTNRMLYEYTDKMYKCSYEAMIKLKDNNYRLAREFAKWKDKLAKNWVMAKILKVEDNFSNRIKITDSLEIISTISLGELDPEDVCVQIYYGKIGFDMQIVDGKFVEMEMIEKRGEDYIYRATISSWQSGLNGYSIRIIPKHKELGIVYDNDLIYWYL
ncbi:MAG: alpha-glucan family phosphorylase [Candidatus Marinimicrobia bacterium]|nr:alpha-glucan family phosphorylase [Candidatus Neomarinimicrobiota bacterium]